MRNLKYLCIFGLIISTGLVVKVNVDNKRAEDASKLPKEVVESKSFIRWITNAKNKGADIDSDEFRLREEYETFSVTNVKVYSLDKPENNALLKETLAQNANEKRVVFSPNGKMLLDYRDSPTGINPTIRIFGLRGNKIVDSQIIRCFDQNNCYFDRAYFLTDDLLVVHEISTAAHGMSCTRANICKLTFKTHVVNLADNKIKSYYSKEKSFSIDEWITKNS